MAQPVSPVKGNMLSPRLGCQAGPPWVESQLEHLEDKPEIPNSPERVQRSVTSNSNCILDQISNIAPTCGSNDAVSGKSI